MNLRAFLRDDAGQDLVEYALLLAFAAFAGGALFSAGGLESMRGIYDRTTIHAAEALNNARVP